MTGKRVDSASRLIRASAEAIYEAWLDREALLRWLPPEGMAGAFERFEPREGGRYRIVLTYKDDSSAKGKATDNADVVEGRFLELRPGESMVQEVQFVSDDPAFAGTMTMRWLITPIGNATRVSITAEDVPTGIRPQDHAAGMESSLANLAAYLE